MSMVLRGFCLERRVVGSTRSYLTLGSTLGPKAVTQHNVHVGKAIIRTVDRYSLHYKLLLKLALCIIRHLRMRQSVWSLC